MVGVKGQLGRVLVALFRRKFSRGIVFWLPRGLHSEHPNLAPNLDKMLRKSYLSGSILATRFITSRNAG